MRRQLLPSLILLIGLTFVLGFGYPLVVTGLSALGFSNQANGSLVYRNGQLVGSSLLGQSFSAADGQPLPGYFQPRPSAAGSGYDATNSGGTNFGPTSQKLSDSIKAAVAAYRTANALGADAPVPADAVTSSASGLDPHISVGNAMIQAARVARARGLAPEKVRALVAANTEGRDLGFLGEAGVNVLRLNIALDGAAGETPAAAK